MARIALRALRWLAGRVPTVLVWAGLGGLFVYGAAHGWKFGDAADPEKEKEKARQSGEEKPDEAGHGSFTPYYQPRPSDVPVLVTHDPAHCTVGEKPLRFRSPDAAARAGITTARVGYARVSATVTAHGEVQQDSTATAKVSPRVGGVLFALEKELGDPVRAGELLALVESAEVGKAKAAYLTAKAHSESREQVRASLSPSVSPPRSIVEAEAAAREARAGLYSARQAMTNLGLPLPTAAEEALPDDALTRQLMLIGVPFGSRLVLYARATRTGRLPTANLLPVFSPLGGVVVRRAGVVGETVAAQQVVYEVGDPTRVYVFLEVRQEDMARVAIGQEMTFRLEGGANLPAVDGAVDWVSPAVDEKTRTVRVRGKVPNPGGVLKGGAYGAGTIASAAPRQALMVPREAVHWEGCSHVVFVRKGGKTGDDDKPADTAEAEYWPRKVTLGARDAGTIEVTAGLAEGEEVVVAGSNVLKGELLKARIGEAE
ncbi:MAG: czcB 4 [Gemmataceae bacterium]|nr:czcB 4 [Gemmataceae bacterium]